MEPYNGTFEMVDLRLIVIDHRYQRAPKPALVAAIASDPRWELFGIPVLFKRSNNQYYVADGQQRILGMKSSKTPPREIPAVWFPVDDLADEAAVFVQINEFRKSLTSLEKHKGKIVAEDPATLAIERSVETAGLTVGGNSAAQDARTINAVAALYWVYDRIAEEGLTQTLIVCRDAFEDDSSAFSSHMLRAVGSIIEEQDGAYERQKLVRALKRTSPHAILRTAKSLEFDLGGSRPVNVRRAIKKLAKV